jgi:hypothetical protein
MGSYLTKIRKSKAFRGSPKQMGLFISTFEIYKHSERGVFNEINFETLFYILTQFFQILVIYNSC